MKHPKKPTRKQKERIKKLRSNYQNWLVVKDTPEEFHIVHRNSNELRIYDKDNKGIKIIEGARGKNSGSNKRIC